MRLQSEDHTCSESSQMITITVCSFAVHNCLSRHFPDSLPDHVGHRGHAAVLLGDVGWPADAQRCHWLLDCDPSVLGWTWLRCRHDLLPGGHLLQRHHCVGILLPVQLLSEPTAVEQQLFSRPASRLRPLQKRKQQVSPFYVPLTSSMN